MNDAQALGDLAALLHYLRESRGFDFTEYKPNSLRRRLLKRMGEVKVESYQQYIEYLEVHPNEFTTLFNTILINVTRFFRDEAAWELVSGDLLPRLLASKPPDAPIRVWSAGCASGQEAYTLAILLSEALGEEAFRQRVKIYATDMDSDALLQARLGTYSARQVQDVPERFLHKYFEVTDGQYTFRKDLRRMLIFGQHDLLQDAPISRVDLLLCRNTMMYFNQEAQSRLLARFNFALNERGYLFLGKAEMLLTRNHLFSPVAFKHRIFTKVVRAPMRVRRSAPTLVPPEDPMLERRHDRLREAAFDSAALTQLVVDEYGVLTLATASARHSFGLTPRDMGRPLQELEVSYRPIQLRTALDQCYQEQRTILIKELNYTTPTGEVLWYEVQLQPLMGRTDQVLGISITFLDISRIKQLQDDFEAVNHELESAYEELQTANEEMETTNEELQSTNEEMETANEELLSTNEELETINEELQATNEELETINNELQQRSEEVDQANAFLQSILTSLSAGVVVVGRTLQVLVWSRKSEELWGLRAAEAEGMHFLNLDIGLPVHLLRQPIRTTLLDAAAKEILIVPATNRRGRSIQCRVTCVPLVGTPLDVQGVILLMEEVKEPDLSVPETNDSLVPQGD